MTPRAFPWDFHAVGDICVVRISCMKSFSRLHGLFRSFPFDGVPVVCVGTMNERPCATARNLSFCDIHASMTGTVAGGCSAHYDFLRFSGTSTVFEML